MKFSSLLLVFLTIACLWAALWRIPGGDSWRPVIAGYTSFITAYLISNFVTGYLAFKNSVNPNRWDGK